MLEGKCPKWGTRYFGWALRNPLTQKCDNCGTQLKVIQQGTDSKRKRHEGLEIHLRNTNLRFITFNCM